MHSSNEELLQEIAKLKHDFNSTIDKLTKDVKRQSKIIFRSDQRQLHEYDALQKRHQEVKELNAEIEATQNEVVFTLGAIGEHRSKETGYHVKRVAQYTYLLAKYYGLPEEECDLLKQASPMHDIGKVAIPDNILNKPAKLTNDEFKTIQEHAQLGYEMLKYSQRPLLKAAATLAHQHHEKYNGSGYPQGLKGEDIHIYGRITAIADVFDALSCKRVYKDQWPDAEVFAYIKQERGKHFDPQLVDIFLENLAEFIAVRDELKDTFLQY